MRKTITEITPLSDKDCFYLVDRYKTEFDYPIHRHDELELNFVSNCKGARRFVGDSIEVLGDYDLALVGPGLEHCWEHAQCGNGIKREITIQFSGNLLGENLLDKTQMRPIKDLLTKASLGLAFGMDSIMKVYTQLEDLTRGQSSGFGQLLQFLEILNTLAHADDKRQLATSSFANARVSSDSRRISKVEEEIDRNYNKDLRLVDLAEIAGMTPSSFSRFFKKRTGRTLLDYLVDIRLGHATRMLVDTTTSISEICFLCGFNNISNFNRTFKRKKGCSPKAFRDNYLKTKTLI